MGKRTPPYVFGVLTFHTIYSNAPLPFSQVGTLSRVTKTFKKHHLRFLPENPLRYIFQGDMKKSLVLNFIDLR